MRAPSAAGAPVLGSQERFLEMYELGMWQANCYILGDRTLQRAVVVDPGQDAFQMVLERLAANDVTCEAILLTHGHLDHVWSTPQLAEKLDVPVFLHPADRWLWDDPAKAFGNFPPGVLETQFGLTWHPTGDRLQDLRDGMRLTCAGMKVEVRHTPGHTPGSSVFLMRDGDPPVLLSGDLVFAGSVGRTDFPRGSFEEQNDSLRRVVLPLDDETRVYSGHGPETTVGVERRTNPFLRALI
ncbi:MAG: MBL fold metallo-hydrolase [Nitriliruptorales bacterium]|nr:MBL fold metallo-hydrolase [Nitriliruptorales bacterium]